MNTLYTSFPENSKVWIFQASRPLTETDKTTIRKYADTFIENWESHGKILKSDYDILHDVFIVFFVDEEGDRMCGSSPGKLIRMIQEVEQELQIELMNRMNMAYLDNQSVKIIKMSDFPQLIKDGEINAETIVFDNTVSSKANFDTKWQLALRNSWQSQFLN